MPDLWEVFLTPHTDDEVLGMAGAITRAHLTGIKTRVILVTDNIPSIRQSRLFPVENLSELRRAEWKKAMECLQVDALEEWEIQESLMTSSPLAAQDMIESRLEEIYYRWRPFHVHTVVGTDDIHADAGYGSLSHALCANAASHFARRHADVRVSLHGVYVYSKPADDRGICGSLRLRKDELSKREQRRKREALLCYREGPGTIGYGYKSVPELFDAAAVDINEYTIELTYNSERVSA